MKKAQGSSVAVLIVLIALFMALYLLFLPAKDRAELLQSNTTNDSSDKEDIAILREGTLLSQNPGLLKPFEKESNKHDINSVNLFLRDEPKIIELANSISISKGVSSEDNQELKFSLDDLKNLDKITLFFLVNEAQGNLIINLNGIQILNKEAKGLQSVTLPNDLLQKNNQLIFKVSSPGINIFIKNKYDLSDIKVRANYELINTNEERTFVLSSNELDENAKLSFFLYCNKAALTRFRILLNEKEIDSEVLSCRSSTKELDLDKKLLKAGDNKLIFELDQGDYLINNVEVKTKSNEGGSKTYKFSLSEKQFDETLNDKEIMLKMSFSSTEEKKKATVNVNGKEFTMETSENDYKRPITSLIKEGNNFIKITPDNEFTLEFLEIVIE
jgi:hypothetical protein